MRLPFWWTLALARYVNNFARDEQKLRCAKNSRFRPLRVEPLETRAMLAGLGSFAEFAFGYTPNL